MIVKEWNRELGTKGKKDRCAQGGGEPYKSGLERIEGLHNREYKLFTRERVEKQIGKICGQCGGSVSLSYGAGGSKNVPPMGGAARGAEKGALTIKEGGGWRRIDSDDEEPLVRKRAKVGSGRKEKAVAEVVTETSDALASKGRAAALVVVEQGTRKRKEKEREKEKETEKKKGGDVVGMGDGRGSGSSAQVPKSTGAGGSTVARGLASSLSKKEGKRVQTGEGRSHKFRFDYEGEGPIMMNPQACGSFFQRIPEAVDEYVGGNVDLDATYDEFAGLVFQLANVEKRFVRGHENVVMESKKEVTALEVEVAKLKEENDALKTLEKDVEDERKRRVFQEEENGRLRFELEKRVEEMERLRRDSLTVESLRNKVTSLEAAVADRDKEIIAVDRGCRMVLKRLLREQADALYARYLEKNEAACDRLDRYLRMREAREEVEGKVDQADGVIEVLEALKMDKVVEVPDSTLLELRGKKDGYEKELQKFEVVEFSSENLRLGLPDSVGSVDIEGIDFKAELMVAEERFSGEEREAEIRSQPVEGGGRSTSDGGGCIDVEN